MALITRDQLASFLYDEADLLDRWRLPEWLQLFTDDAEYLVPSEDLAADASPDNSLFYIADDRARLGERVKRLMKRTAHSEFPHSSTRHLVHNIRFTQKGDDDVDVESVFATWRLKDGVRDLYLGTSYYRLQVADGSFRIRSKRCVLAGDSLRPAGRISIIL
jgi:p-cumate 2,3-dioxygenase subunit beta